MLDTFVDFLWDHTWAMRVFIILTGLIGICGDVATFYVTFTCGDPIVIFVVWGHRLLLLRYELQAGDNLFDVLRDMRNMW